MPISTSSLLIEKPSMTWLVKESAFCQSGGWMEAEPSRTIITSSFALHGGGGPGGGGGGTGLPPDGQVSNEITVAVVIAVSKSDTSVLGSSSWTASWRKLVISGSME